jgi:hypothetical protein
MLLQSQKTVLDGSEPEIIIIPLLTVAEVLRWNGRDEYEAMAITCGSRAQLAARQVLQFARDFCEAEEIEKGRILLEAFTRGIASSVKQHDVRESFESKELRSQELAAWSALVSEIKSDGRAKVFLPKVLSSQTRRKLGDIQVAKGEMSTRFSLPDPFLVAVKAAISYSKLCGKALMPVCPDAGSDASFDDSDDDVPARDFSSILASLANPGRQRVELFSDGS